MKILIDARLLNKESNSGVPEYARQMISNLLESDRKNEYSLFCNSWRRNRPLPFSEQKVNWRVPNNLLTLSSKILNWPRVDKLTKADVIYSPHLNLLRSGGAARVITIHDLSFIHHPYFFKARSRLWHWLQDIKIEAKKAAAVVTLANFTKQDIHETLEVPLERIHVIHPGVNNFEEPGFIYQKPTHPYFLYLGTLEPRKNVELVIRSFNLLKQNKAYKEVKLILAGRLGWLYKNIIDTYKASPFKEDIKLTGPVSHQQKIELYSRATALIYPSFFEGFGLPIVEAQMRGCPVVVSNRTVLPEVINKSGILIDPWRVDQLANAMEQLLTDDQLRNNLVAAGRQNVRRFNWRRSAEELCELFWRLFY